MRKYCLPLENQFWLLYLRSGAHVWCVHDCVCLSVYVPSSVRRRHRRAVALWTRSREQFRLSAEPLWMHLHVIPECAAHTCRHVPCSTMAPMNDRILYWTVCVPMTNWCRNAWDMHRLKSCRPSIISCHIYSFDRQSMQSMAFDLNQSTKNDFTIISLLLLLICIDISILCDSSGQQSKIAESHKSSSNLLLTNKSDSNRDSKQNGERPQQSSHCLCVRPTARFTINVNIVLYYTIHINMHVSLYVYKSIRNKC